MVNQILVKKGMDKDEVISIRDLVIAEFARMDVKVEPGGGYRGTVRQIDHGRFNLKIDDKDVGFFKYVLNNEKYEIQLDLSRLPAQKYDEFVKTAKSRFPYLFKVVS